MEIIQDSKFYCQSYVLDQGNRIEDFLSLLVIFFMLIEDSSKHCFH